MASVADVCELDKLVVQRPLMATSRHSMGYAKESALTPKADVRGPMSAFPPISSALHLGADVLVTCPRLPVMTQSGHSLDYGVQKVCVPKTSDLRTLVAGR